MNNFTEREASYKAFQNVLEAFRMVLIADSTDISTKLQSIIDIWEATPTVQIAGATFTADSVTLKVPTTISSGTKAVTGTQAALASTTPAKWVIITNANASGTVYWGATGITTSTGEPIYPMTSVWIPISDPAKIYVIGDAVTVRYKVLN